MERNHTNDRYFLEHKFLPAVILGDDGASVIMNILDAGGKFFTDIYAMIHEDDKNYTCPYSPGDFSVKGVKFNDVKDLYAVKINMPAPERSPLCIMVFITHDSNMESRRYITVEQGAEDGAFLCEWKPDGLHANYGAFTESNLKSVILGE